MRPLAASLISSAKGPAQLAELGEPGEGSRAYMASSVLAEEYWKGFLLLVTRNQGKQSS